MNIAIRGRVACPLPAGGCTIHQGRTMHASGPNRSNMARYAYVLSFAIPPVPARKPRIFAWLKEQDTARSRRMQAWLRRGGVFIETWRMFKKTEPRDYGKIIPNFRRKVGNMVMSWRNRKSRTPEEIGQASGPGTHFIPEGRGREFRRRRNR